MPKNTKNAIEVYIKQGKSIYNLDYKNPDEVDATMIYVACKNYLQSLDSGLREKKVPECLIQLEDFVRKM
jgi:poly(3-hydroxyalkanoate) synthetase